MRSHDAASAVVENIFRYGDEPSPEWIEHCIREGLKPDGNGRG